MIGLDDIIADNLLLDAFKIFMTKKHKMNELECYIGLNCPESLLDFNNFYNTYIDPKGFKAINISAALVRAASQSDFEPIKYGIKEQIHLEDLPSFFSSKEYKDYCLDKLRPTIESRLKHDPQLVPYIHILHQKGLTYAHEIESTNLFSLGILKLGHSMRIKRLCKVVLPNK